MHDRGCLLLLMEPGICLIGQYPYVDLSHQGRSNISYRLFLQYYSRPQVLSPGLKRRLESSLCAIFRLGISLITEKHSLLYQICETVCKHYMTALFV